MHVVHSARLLLVVGGLFVGSLSTRKGFAVDVMKDRGSLGREVALGAIENVYRMQVMNGLERQQHYHASVRGLPGLQLVTAPDLTVEATGINSLAIRLSLPADAAQNLRGQTVPIVFQLQTEVDGRVVSTEEKSTFYGPR